MAHAVRLDSRAVLRVTGPDALRFLQGLVTVDVHRLCRREHREAERALFGAFLNRRGRVEHVALLVNGTSGDACANGAPGEILLDCARESADALRTHLLRHRLRARVQVSDARAELAVSAHFGADDAYFADPRAPTMASRALLPVADASALRGDEGDVDALRILSGAPCEADSAGVLPLALALDRLSAVDFDKGCYLGQESTARAHFTGVVRRRIAPLLAGERAARVLAGGVDAPARLLETAFSRDEECMLRAGDQLFFEGGEKAGVLSSVCGNAGLAVLSLGKTYGRGDGGGKVGAKLVTAGGMQATPWMPAWWREDIADSAAS